MLSFEHTAFDYLLVLRLPREVERQVTYFKDVFQDRYNFPNALITYPHLTLLKFRQFRSYEELIVNRLKQMAGYVNPFQITLSGFSLFENVFFLNVTTRSLFLDIVYKQRSLLLPLLCAGSNYYHFVHQPHVTIARALLKNQSQEVRRTWTMHSYEADFTVSDMLLIKRGAPYESYKPVCIIRFKGNKSYPKQGRLF